jgi:hypothetical protein
LKTLVEKYPEAAAAELAEFLAEIAAVGRVVFELNDGNASTRMLPVRAI